MKQIANQFRRLFSDNGQNDKDFTKEELELKVAKNKLDRAIAGFKAAADHLYETLLGID